MDLCQASAILEDLQKKLTPVLLIWLMLLLELLQMLKLLLMPGLLLMLGLELLLLRLLLMPELLLLLPKPLLPDHLNWSSPSRLVFKLAETWLASAEILLSKQ